MKRVAAGVLMLALAASAGAQTFESSFTQRGFIEAGLLAFPQSAPNDRTRAIADLLIRQELFVKPVPWLQLAAGVDVRANSHDQVDGAWEPDMADRGVRRPRLSARRLMSTLTWRRLSIDAGKQFIRWGKTDVITPTDRFAPRDFLNVISSELLPVSAVRISWSARNESIEGVWVPRLTPSRVPLFEQRWTALPQPSLIPVRDAGARIPAGSQVGARWSHTGAGFEYAFSYFDGFNHLPNIDVQVDASAPAVALTRVYPKTRAYGVESAVPTAWFTLKGEVEYFTSPAASTSADEYALYVLQIERQTGEWVLVAGYAGEIVTEQRSTLAFSPDRGMTKAVVARAAYTIDPRRSVAFEGAARQSGDGLYGKAEYSEARGAHWRLTLGAVVIAGHADDFLGQYRRNSHVAAAVRYSF